MLPWLGELIGNPSSIHAPGRRARGAVDDSRDRIASLLGAKPHEIIFTSGGTESCNLAILGLARRHRTSEKNHLVTISTEHHAVLHAMRWLAAVEGFDLTELPVNSQGLVDPKLFEASLRPDTILASVMIANNETGLIQPVPELAAICHARGILFHTDAVQAFGKIPCRPDDLGVDALTATSHKFYGPHGAGFLWLRSGVSIQAIQHGGFHENERRPGTENVTAIVGMTAAAVSALDEISEGTEALRLGRLREEFWEKIAALDTTAIRNSAGAPILFTTLNVSFPGCDGETLLMGLDLEGVSASSGSACMVGSIQASHVLLAMGVSEDNARATVRFSLGHLTTRHQIELAVSALGRVLSRQSR